MNEIAVVTEQDIPDILRMIHEIYSELPNKEWFSLDSDEEVTSYMMTGGFGLKAMCDGRSLTVLLYHISFFKDTKDTATGSASCILSYLKDLPLAGYFLLYIIFSPRMNM